MLIGRERECGVVDSVLKSARKGRSSTLVLRGEPGVGKSALLAYARARAHGMRVLEARGFESDSELPFSALLDLLRPILERLAEIPPTQGAALSGALALGPPAAADRFGVSAAVLSLLAAAAEQAPLLALIDDAQWLDASSREALLFAARRMHAEQISMVLAIREGEGATFDESGLDELVIAGLGREAAHALLAAQKEWRLSAHVAERVVAGTGGNPLALIETPASMTEGQRLGLEPLDEPLPAGPGMERAFRRRVDALPSRSRMALLVAAASESGSLDEVGAVIELMGFRLTALEPAERAGLVSLRGERLEFRHPLVRSAVYHGAAAGSRRRMHAAFATTLADERRPGPRAWHLAKAAVGPDDAVAAELERAALNARDRGGHAGAATAFERAGRLTRDDAERARRLLEAARDWGPAGRSARAAELLAEALALAADPLLRADVQHERGRVMMWNGAPMAAHELLVREAGLIEALDPTRAAMMSIDAVGPCLMAGFVDKALSTCEWAQGLCRRAGPPWERLIVLPLGFALVASGRATEARSFLLEAEQYLSEVDPVSFDRMAVLGTGQAFIWLEEYGRARSLLERSVKLGREFASVGTLPYPLAVLSDLEFRVGNWSAALASASESAQLADEVRTERALSLASLGRIEAAQGREGECRDHVAEAFELSVRFGVGSIRTYGGSDLGLLELGLGHSEAAVTALEDVARFVGERGLRDPSVVQWAPDLIEAYVRLNRTAEAERALQTFKQQAKRTGRTWALAAAARCRGLLPGEHDFEREFVEALSWHDRTPTPFERARTELCFGEKLRRAGRRSEARGRLRAALTTFERLGAMPWAEQARTELRASGERARRRVATPSPQLTGQELQVALVVVKGATNREAAAALFLSPKTIEFHLRNIYGKLDIRSRTELAYRLNPLRSTSA